MGVGRNTVERADVGHLATARRAGALRDQGLDSAAIAARLHHEGYLTADGRRIFHRDVRRLLLLWRRTRTQLESPCEFSHNGFMPT